MALDALWGFFSFMGRVRKEFSEVAGCSVLERATGRFQNAPCSATMADYLVLKLMILLVIIAGCSATMADYLVLKRHSR